MENPRIDFEEEMYDQCDHSYQDGFNSGYKQGQIDTIKRFCNITPQKTNADRIRAMTDEKLAEWFAGHDAGLVANVLNNDYVEPTKDGWLEWLKQECEP